VFLLALACAAASAQSPKKTGKHHRIAEADPAFPPELIQAENAIEKKEYAAAEPLLKKVVAANPGNYQAWFDLGFVYNAQGNQEESIAAYRKSVAAKPDVFESNLNLGLMLARAGQPEGEQFLRAATKLKPTSNPAEGQARAWLSLARLVENTKPDQALEAYRQVAALQPKDPEPHLSAGLLLENLKRFEDSEQEYKQAVLLQPDSTEAVTGLANLFMRSRRFTEAEQMLRKLTAMRPDNVAAHVQLGRILAALGRNEDAVAELETAAGLAPGDEAAQRDLADLYVATGKYDQAEARYRPLLQAKPNEAELHHGLGRVLLKQGRFPEAQEQLLLAVKLKPNFGAAYGDLAAAANENKNYELAIRALDERGKFLPEIPVGYFLRATAYDHLRDYKQAAENYHRFLELANGKYPDQEWQARHRLIAIEPKKK
jgi:tetratricopeptide (TPR) repeat protein